MGPSPPLPASATYNAPCGPNDNPRGLSSPLMTTVTSKCRRASSVSIRAPYDLLLVASMTGPPSGMSFCGGLRYHERTAVLGAQTVRRGGVGPVRSLLGGKPHRPLFFLHDLFDPVRLLISQQSLATTGGGRAATATRPTTCRW